MDCRIEAVNFSQAKLEPQRAAFNTTVGVSGCRMFKVQDYVLSFTGIEESEKSTFLQSIRRCALGTLCGAGTPLLVVMGLRKANPKRNYKG